MSLSLKQRLRSLLIPASMHRDLAALRLTQGRILTELNARKPLSDLNACEFRVFSQFGEDGIIQALVRQLPVAHRTFIEFGVEDFAESNCRFLMMNDNWRGLVLDGSKRRIEQIRSSADFWKYDLETRVAFVTRENVNELLASSGFDADLGLLSIDVDGMDYWIMDALASVRPRILIVEYNALFGPERKITVPYDAQFEKMRAHYSGLYFGASLGALNAAAEHRGYSLVATESSGVNAFFVRDDLMANGLRKRTVAEAYHDTNARQSRAVNGKLDYLDHAARIAAISGFPVVDIETGETQLL